MNDGLVEKPATKKAYLEKHLEEGSKKQGKHTKSPQKVGGDQSKGQSEGAENFAQSKSLVKGQKRPPCGESDSDEFGETPRESPPNYLRHTRSVDETYSLNATDERVLGNP